MTVESIEWKAYPDTEPDDGIMVLIHAPGAAEPVWPGYLDWDVDLSEWRWADGNPVVEDVTAWAELPSGSYKLQVIVLPPDMTDTVQRLARLAFVTPQELVCGFLHEAFTLFAPSLHRPSLRTAPIKPH